jgi:hypothetical protein
MRKFPFLVFALCAAVVVWGNQIGLPPQQSVVYDFDRSAPFDSYKTYKWVAIPSKEQLDELTSGQLTGTFEVELGKKGLNKTNGNDADLYIGYQVSSAGEKQLKSYNVGASYGSVGGGSATGSVAATTVHTGQLILLMFDGAKKQLVWRGVVSNAIDAEANPDKKQKHMTSGVEKLLKHYPPPKK